MYKRIKLMAYFDCYPLWDMDDVGDIDPAELPLIEKTIARLLEWQKIYDGKIYDVWTGTTRDRRAWPAKRSAWPLSEKALY